jgi:hypothetical protein
VFLSLCYGVFRWILQLAALRVRSSASKDLEIVVLRHELAILQRQSRRPTMTGTDRFLLAAAQPSPGAGRLARLLRDARDAAAVASSARGEALDVPAGSRSPAHSA